MSAPTRIDPYRLADLPIRASSFVGLDRARGHVDTLIPKDDHTLHVSGWISAPGKPIDDIEVYRDGRYLKTIAVLPTPGLKDLFPWYPHAEAAGFSFELPLISNSELTTSRLDLIARDRAVPTAKLSQLVRMDVDRFPTAPELLTFRVAHIRDAHQFKVGGLRSVGDFLEAFARHGDLSTVRRVLDWGCGCGRMSMYFVAAADCPEFAGCDIDGDAVRWDNQYLREGAFTTLDLMPPSPYPSDRFDLILAYSVFTHLARDVQRAWLQELRRILAPGGIVLASVHGQIAYDFARRKLGSRFPRRGIADRYRDRTLVAVAPRGYYRVTYQSQEYTRREFGRFLSILEYVELGAINQDLIVMRKD